MTMANEANHMVIVIVQPMRHCHAVSLLFSGRHSFRHSSNLLATLSKEARTRGDDEIQGLHACRHVSVMYISVKVVITASWVRRHSQSSVDLEKRGTSHCGHRNGNDFDIEAQHTAIFQFDKAFAQEIKYLHAELDFDLYMCRDKQTEMNEARETYELGQFFRVRNGNNDSTVGLRFDIQGKGRPQVIHGSKGKVNEESISHLSGPGDSARRNEMEKANYKQSERISQKRQIGPSNDSSPQRTIIQRNFRVFIDENNNGILDFNDKSTAERLQGNHTMKNDTSIDDSVQLHGIEHSLDVSIGNCFRQCEVPAAFSVQDYIHAYRREVVAVKDYLRTLPVSDDITVEEYIENCQRMECQDVTVEDYLRQFAIPVDVMEEEYVRLCERGFSKDVTVEEYLELQTVSDDITVEGYIERCQRMEWQDVTVEDYLRQFAIPVDVIEEECKRLCGRGISKDITVEEYLELHTVSDDNTVEGYIERCQRMECQDVTVEDYLREFTIPVDVVEEEYCRLCERGITRDVTIEEYLELHTVSDDITVEGYIERCQRMEWQDVTVEDYLREFAIPVDVIEEECERLCGRGISKDFTVEEYLELHTVSGDITVTEYEICETEQDLRQLTALADARLEEYPKKCMSEESEDVTVEDYLRQFSMPANNEGEDYLRQYGREQQTGPLDEDFHPLMKFKLDVLQSLNGREILYELHSDEVARDVNENEIVEYRNTEAEAKAEAEAEVEQVINLNVTGVQKGNNSSSTDPYDNTERQFQKHIRIDCLIIESSLEAVCSHDSDVGSLIASRGEKNRLVIEETIAEAFIDDMKAYLNVCPFDVEDENVKLNVQKVGALNQRSAEAIITSSQNIADGIVNCDNVNIKMTLEEDCIDRSQLPDTKGSSMPKLFHNLEKKYSAELWLIFVPHRRIPCTQVSVLYQDIISCDWHFSTPVEIVSNTSGTCKNISVRHYDPLFGILNRLEKKVPSIEEAEVYWPQIGSNLSERELRDLPVYEDPKENIERKTRKTESEMIAQQEPTLNTPLLTVTSTAATDSASFDAYDLQPSSSDSFKNESFMVRSKDKLQSVSENEGKRRLSSLERLQCKHTKSIALPDSLRRSVSTEFMKFICSDGENTCGTRESLFQDIEKQYSGKLQISPLKFQFGKNVKESNV